MEGLVNYSSEEEQDEPKQSLAHSGNYLPNRSSNIAGGGKMNNSNMTSGGGVITSDHGRSSYREENSSKHKSSHSNNRSFNSRESGRDGPRDNRDPRDNRESRDYGSNNRYDYKMNDRNRFKDYKSDYRDGRRAPRDDDRSRYSSSSSWHHKDRHNNSRDERYNDGARRHHRSRDDRNERSDRNDRKRERSSDRHHRRDGGESRSPSPHHAHNTNDSTMKRSSKNNTQASRSRSRSPYLNVKEHFGATMGNIYTKSNSPSVMSSDAKQALEKARLSALEMERKLMIDDHDLQHKEKQSSTVTACHVEALTTLPLADSAPKQPNVIAVAPSASSANAEPAVIQLPSYYNPSIINPNKYAEQVQKRKLLWGAKKTEDSASKWGNAQFSQDDDGKVASKFMRLMGIKGAAPKTEVADEQKISTPDVKSREVMFSNMEQQYEVARQATHTMRGVGLGFSSQSRPF